jgi:UDP-N-acetylmuramate dehydrogenase
MERNGEVKKLEKKDIECSYRHTVLPEGAVVLSATIKGVKEKPEIIKAKIDSLVLQRIQSQPQNVRTGGSTFKNPKGHSAWELIRQSGADKFKVGGAEVSEKHANFLINTGNATGQDIYTLGEEIRSAVLKHSGINLEWEIQMIGKF